MRQFNPINDLARESSWWAKDSIEEISGYAANNKASSSYPSPIIHSPGSNENESRDR
jgi:hypothetical protein